MFITIDTKIINFISLLCVYCLTDASTHKYVSIWGGELADIEAFPFMASVQLQRTHVCAGVVVSEIFVLTTASCLEIYAGETHEYSVVVGTADLRKGGYAYGVAETVKHEEYPEKQDHDIGLLKLLDPLSLNSEVAVASLPKEGMIFSFDSEFDVTGWGPGENNDNGILKTTKVDIISSRTCRRSNGDEFDITKYTICAGTNNHGPCTGDLAAPLTLNGTVVGITSRAKRCASERYPTVYVKVSEFRKWIDREIMNNHH